MSPTTEFDQLMKHAFKVLFPGGSARNYFKAKSGSSCYQKAVKPDFVIDGTKWVDFKLHVSYYEKSDVPWRPSALYASLRKYIDHVDNKYNKLIIVYGQVHGTIDHVQFPILRGSKVLIRNKNEFADKVKLVPAYKVLDRLMGTEHEWIIKKISYLVRQR